MSSTTTGSPGATETSRPGATRRRLRTAAILIVIIATVVAAYVCYRQPTRVFTTRADLFFVVPRSARIADNARGENVRSMIYFAGLVEREWDRGRGYPDLASPVAPLYATGLRSAVTVTLPNQAGQFEHSFLFQKLIIQTVDPTAAGAQRLLDETITDLQRISDGLQVSLNVRPDDFITTFVNPQTPQAIGQPAYWTRAVAGVLGIGVILVAALSSRRRIRVPALSRPRYLQPVEGE